MTVKLATEAGQTQLEGLTFKLDNETLPAGTYEVVIKDVTHGIEESQRREMKRFDLKLFDSEVEAELAAAAAPVKGGKKK